MHKRHLVWPLTATIPLLCSPAAFSAGFAIIENSASGMGAAFAGAAATGEDASTVWFNPAAMSRLGDKTHVLGAGHVIMPTADFSDRGTTVNPAFNGGTTKTPDGSGNDDGGSTAFVPNFYYVKPINDRTHFGLGINAPFGLEVTYNDDWVGRYLATKSEMMTLNINPAVSWQANDKLSLGAGVSAQYIDVSLGSAIDLPSACVGTAQALNNGTIFATCAAETFVDAGVASKDSKAEITGDDISYGFNLGLLYEPTDYTRLGVAYRSKIKHKLEGDADYTANAALGETSLGASLLTTVNSTIFRDRPVSAEVELPDSLSFSVAHKLNNRIELLGDATWTGWSSFKELRVEDNGGNTVTVTPEEWKDVWRIAVGGSYQYNDKLKLRAGVAYDESPIPDPQRRTPRIPGNDRTWLAMGAGYEVNKNLNLDFGYAHLFVDDTPIDHTNENGYTIRGVYEADVDILSAQLNWSF